MLAGIHDFFKKALTLCINLYRWLRPRRYPCCAFIPSCSEYAIEALRKKNVIHAFYLIIIRVSRCHPWAKGGYDPVR